MNLVISCYKWFRTFIDHHITYSSGKDCRKHSTDFFFYYYNFYLIEPSLLTGNIPIRVGPEGRVTFVLLLLITSRCNTRQNQLHKPFLTLTLGWRSDEPQGAYLMLRGHQLPQQVRLWEMEEVLIKHVWSADLPATKILHCVTNN